MQVFDGKTGKPRQLLLGARGLVLLGLLGFELPEQRGGPAHRAAHFRRDDAAFRVHFARARKHQPFAVQYAITEAGDCAAIKALKGNAIVNGLELEKTRIVYGSSTWASRPAKRGGMRFKRAFVVLKAKEVAMKEKTEKKQKQEKNK